MIKNDANVAILKYTDKKIQTFRSGILEDGDVFHFGTTYISIL